MRVAVVSDIHANLAALETVLAAIDADAPDELWCLGDLVGYGPRPSECCEAVAARARICLAGNHDLAVRRDDRPARLQRRSGRRRPLDARGPDRAGPRVSRGARAGRRRRRRLPLPRERTGPGLGVRPLRRGGRGDARPHRHAARPRRPQPRGAAGLAPGRRPRRRPRSRRNRARPGGGPVPAQSRLRRAAPRRRPEGCVPHSSTSTPAVRASAASSTTSRGRRRRSSKPGCPNRWRYGCRAVSSGLRAPRKTTQRRQRALRPRPGRSRRRRCPRATAQPGRPREPCRSAT